MKVCENTDTCNLFAISCLQGERKCMQDIFSKYEPQDVCTAESPPVVRSQKAKDEAPARKKVTRLLLTPAMLA